MAPSPGPYAVLGVGAAASAEEIRAAFKRAALLAHPDKGGSKEAFHAVYAAFETLVDALNRSRYDAKQASQGQAAERAESGRRSSCHGAAGAAPGCAAAAGRGGGGAGSPRPPAPAPGGDDAGPAELPRAGPGGAKRRREGAAGQDAQRPADSAPVPEAAGGGARLDRVLAGLHRALRQLDGAARRHVLASSLCEAERLSLEAWMRAGRSAPDPTQRRGAAEATAGADADQCDAQSECDDDDPELLMLGDGADGSSSGSGMEEMGDAPMLLGHEDGDPPAASASPTASDPAPMCELPTFTRGAAEVRGISTMTYKRSGYRTYRVNVSIDHIVVTARDVRDLPTALDALMVLTTLKQRALADPSLPLPGRFRAALQETLAECKAGADLGLKFAVAFRQHFWLGRHQLCTPRLATVDAALLAWQCCTPHLVPRGVGKRHALWWLGFAELRQRWLALKDAFADACYAAGLDRDEVLAHLHLREASGQPNRERIQRYWERVHMREEDARRGYKGRAQLTPQEKERRALASVDRWLVAWRTLRSRQLRAEALSQRRAVAQRRREMEARWRRHHRLGRDLTMADIMGPRFEADAVPRSPADSPGV